MCPSPWDCAITIEVSQTRPRRYYCATTKGRDEDFSSKKTGHGWSLSMDHAKPQIFDIANQCIHPGPCARGGFDAPEIW